LQNIETIALESKGITEIPEYAFKQKKLRSLNLGPSEGDFGQTGELRSIGNNAFTLLDNLEDLKINYQKLSQIPVDAFRFQNVSNKTLSIQINNNSLTGNSFVVGAFSNMSRPTVLDLSSNGIQYLKKDIFMPFLEADAQNVLKFDYNPIDCKDCLSLWIRENFNSEFSGIVGSCADGSSLFNPNNFLNQTNCKCPDASLLRPCVCYPLPSSSIQCSGQLNLKETFTKLSYHIREEYRSFNNFRLYNSTINELEESVFGNITFESVSFYYMIPNLTKIHTNVFNGPIAKTVKSILLDDIPIDENSQNHSIFEALNKLENVERIEWQTTQIKGITANMFRQKSLRDLTLTAPWNLSGKMSSIGENAFTLLDSLDSLVIQSQNLSRVGTNLFGPEHSSISMHIDLTYNPLTGDSFESRAFSNIEGPTSIYIDKNHIKYFKESVFLSFLREHPSNYLQIIYFFNIYVCLP